MDWMTDNQELLFRLWLVVAVGMSVWLGFAALWGLILNHGVSRPPRRR